MAVIFKSNNAKFPANETALTERLTALEKLINAENSNVQFVESAFKLMEDCDLINADNVKFLTDAIALKCKHRHFKFPNLPTEGALRQVTNYGDIADRTGFSRFYNGTERRVEFEGKMYLISNDWYKDNNPCPNKRQFYNWLADKALTACKAYWHEQALKAAAAPKKPSAGEILLSNVNQLDNKINVLFSNLSMMNNKMDALSAEINQLNNRIDQLSTYVSQTNNALNTLDKLPAHMAEFATLKNKVDALNAQIDGLKKGGLSVTARWNN